MNKITIAVSIWLMGITLFIYFGVGVLVDILING